ncbi:hypothetical protein M758_12G138200 [Ceratodon purpureus]|nr:hypothetical protein M758_12G138200 [Ceratodon purpureus]
MILCELTCAFFHSVITDNLFRALCLHDHIAPRTIGRVQMTLIANDTSIHRRILIFVRRTWCLTELSHLQISAPSQQFFTIPCQKIFIVDRSSCHSRCSG